MIINPANRLNTVQEYYFSKKLKEISKMNSEGKNVINLGIGSPDLPPSENVILKLKQSSDHKNNHGYQSYIGIKELREAFAKWYKSYYNVILNAESEILPLIGSKEGILYVSLAFINPGDEVLVPNPGYPTYSSVSNLVEAKIIYYDLLENSNWEPDFNALEKSDLSKVKLMWVNYPNMPTGASASKQLFNKLINFAKKHKILICNDNPYSFILNDKPLSILGIPEAKDAAIELNSLSKSHNMAGWRLGMVAGKEDYIQTIIKVNSNVHSGIFKPIQEAAVEALNNPPSWYQNLNLIYKERREIVWEIFNILDCQYDKTRNGMFVWAKIPQNKKTAEIYSNEILYQAGVFITPGFIFGTKGINYLRISLCSDIKLLTEAKNRIEKI